MNALDAILAPNTIPDHQSDEYQAARRVLEGHPATADMEPGALSSLAQHLANVIADDLHTEIRDLRDELTTTEGDLILIDKERARLNHQLGKANREIAALKGGAK